MSNSESRALRAFALWTILWTALSTGLLASACAGTGGAPPDDARKGSAAEDSGESAGGDGAVAFETIYQTQQSAIEEPRLEAVLDAAALDRVWRALGAGGAPPEIDFTREMVILAAIGTRSNTCYRVEITTIDATSGGLAVEVTHIVPGKDCMCGMAITYPAHLVRLARHDGPVSFTDLSVPRDCS